MEVRLSSRDKNIAELREQIRVLETQNEEYRTEIDKYKTIADNSIPFHQVEKIKIQYHAEIQALKEEIAALQTRPHNERNAGRKRKATPEQIEYILSLSADGHSQVKIAKILTEQTGGKWNKSTVRNIIISAKI